MQNLLTASGDSKAVAPPNRALHNRRSTGSSSIKKSGTNMTGSGFLATDKTNLDINDRYMSKKPKRNNVTGGHSFLNSQQANGFAYPSYFNPATLYTNMDLMQSAVTSSGDVPSLMSVNALKPSGVLQGLGESQVMDFAQFTEELNAIQNMPYSVPTSPISLQSLFSMNEFGSSSYMTSSPKSSMLSTGGRVSGGRKNRMVEVKTINDRSVVVVSDPQAASASARSTVVPLNCQVLSVNQANIETSKKRSISAEPLYSRKVFIGGLPIDVTEEEVWTTFGAFGKVLVDWPRRPEHGGRGDMFESEMGRRNLRSVSGYVFLVFQTERSVQELVNACEYYEHKYYLQLSSPTMSDKAVQVRPWRLSDIDYFCDNECSVDHRRTVFIGGVPRPTRASDLAHCLQEHYGKVSYVGIDIDPELKYPKGAARVTFATAQSFVRAISGRFVQVTHAESNKRVEIKPYVMEDQHCDECEGKLCKHNYAPYFCGDSSCLQYYCEACWDRMHYSSLDDRSNHRPMVRTGDQTKVFTRPPHHSTGYHPRQHQQHSYIHHNTVNGMEPIHSIRSNTTSVIDRIVNRNASMTNSNIKPFSAVPTSIGF